MEKKSILNFRASVQTKLDFKINHSNAAKDRCPSKLTLPPIPTYKKKKWSQKGKGKKKCDRLPLIRKANYLLLSLLETDGIMKLPVFSFITANNSTTISPSQQEIRIIFLYWLKTFLQEFLLRLV